MKIKKGKHLKKLEENRSKGRKLNILFKKGKKMLGDYQSLAEFKEPIMFLLRRTGMVEFYEGVTIGKYEFTHSCGQQREIDLLPTRIRTFEYGKRTFKGYVCDEDQRYPLPNDPIVDAESYAISLEKTLHDKKEWETKKLRAKSDFAWTIAYGIAIIIAVLIAGAWLIPESFWKNVFGNKDTAKTTIETVPLLLPIGLSKLKSLIRGKDG